MEYTLFYSFIIMILRSFSCICNCIFCTHSIIKGSQPPKTMCMNSMSTGQIQTCMSGGMHILSTNRTTILKLILQTNMVIIGIGINTHGTIIAMDEVFTSSDTTNTTFVTMEWLLGGVHPQIAYIAVIFSEFDVAVDTFVGTFLSCVAFFADDFSD